ncbi:unnamed protein product [Pieris brassicae]|uniref:Peptidase M14 carboxypeptidase A domain-containing protein n=1 Tax=Pieris brassicae TaxID=7116 RepID=A0A9P0TU31_PIEBR|nr:unnamed protein product [Pieris brassicae]
MRLIIIAIFALLIVVESKTFVRRKIHPITKFEESHRHKRDFSFEEYFNKLQTQQATAVSYVRKIMGTGPLANNLIIVGIGEHNNNNIYF